jgi:hypothetical protein
MKKLLLPVLVFCCFTASAQSWTQIAGRQRFVTALGIPTRDTAAGVAADSSQILIRPADSSLYIKYKRTWVKVGSGGGGTIGGSGTTNYIPKFTSSTAIGNSQIFDNGTNIGIGTASPANKLDVFATNRTALNTEGSGVNVNYSGSNIGEFATIGFSWPSSIGNNSTQWGMGMVGTNFVSGTAALNFFTNGSERMRITSGGNVGIGTASPSERLHVNGGTFIVSNSASTTSQVNIGIGTLTANRPFIGTNTSSNALEIGTRDAVGTVFVTNSSPRMTITSGGNALIGTTTDNGVDRLQVSGSMNVSTNIKVGTYLISSYNNEILAGVDAAGYYFANGASGTSNIPINFGDRASYIGFKTSPSTAAGIEKMRITSSGRILMGATLPTDNGVDALQVSGSMNVSGNVGIGTLSAATLSMQVEKDVNNVHVTSLKNRNSGSAATTNLTLANDANLGLEFTINSTTASGTFWGFSRSNLVSNEVLNFNSNWIFNLGNSIGSIAFGLNGNEAFRIPQSRRILFNTTTDNGTDRLQVNGSIQGTGFNQAYLARTTTYTATTSDYFIDCTSGTFTVNLFTAVGNTGRILIIKNSGTGTITVDGSGTQTIDGAATYSLSAQWATVQIMCDGNNWKIISKF